jgi:hypothetical protein
MIIERYDHVCHFRHIDAVHWDAQNVGVDRAAQGISGRLVIINPCCLPINGRDLIKEDGIRFSKIPSGQAPTLGKRSLGVYGRIAA